MFLAFFVAFSMFVRMLIGHNVFSVALASHHPKAVGHVDVIADAKVNNCSLSALFFVYVKKKKKGSTLILFVVLTRTSKNF